MSLALAIPTHNDQADLAQLVAQAADLGIFDQLVVVDDGPGVDPAALPRLAERRFVADGPAAGAGSGLGLSIVGAICRRAGWTLGFGAAEPSGLIVTIRGGVGTQDKP